MNKSDSFFFSFFGIVAVTAVLGLVLLFGTGITTGRVPLDFVCDTPSIPVLIRPGETPDFLPQLTNASYTCEQTAELDEYGYETWCCTPPPELPEATRFLGIFPWGNE